MKTSVIVAAHARYVHARSLAPLVASYSCVNTKQPVYTAVGLIACTARVFVYITPT